MKYRTNFLKQMNNSFHMQFRDFNVALDQLKKAQKENTAYTSAMYQTMSQKLSETYEKQDKRGKLLINSQMEFCREATEKAEALKKKEKHENSRVFIPAEPAEDVEE